MHRLIQYLSLLGTLAFGIIAHAQPTTFEFFLKSDAYEGAGGTYEHDNGFYYLLGAREDTLAVPMLFDILLLKVSQNGDTMTCVDHSPDTSVGVGYIKKSGDNMLAIGSYHFNNDSIGGIYNITFNAHLEVIRKKAIPFPVPYYFNISSAGKVLTDKTKNYIYIVSLTEPYNNQGYDGGDVCFYKFDVRGDTICTYILKMDKSQRVDAASFNSDSTELWLFGSGFQEGTNQWVRFDMDFNLISIEEFYLNANYPLSIKQECTNTWIGCGRFVVYDKTQDDEIWVFRMNTKGDLLNEFTLGSPDTIDYPAFGRSIGFSSVGDIFIAGTNNFVIGLPPPDYPSWVMLTKFDSAFNHVFTRFYNPDDKYYESIDLYVCSDGGIILSNQRYDSYNNENTPYDWDSWILKVDGNGYMTGQGEKPDIEIKNALLFPNPGGDQLQVSCGWPDALVSLYNMNGQLAAKKKLTALTTTVNTSALASGNYTWTVTIENNTIIEKGKWIKTK